jgi:hypothetical protein
MRGVIATAVNSIGLGGAAFTAPPAAAAAAGGGGGSIAGGGDWDARCASILKRHSVQKLLE